jgi:FixJ family two-component response regulator
MSNKPTIYLCDDEEEVRKGLSFQLRHSDLSSYEVRAYASGQSLVDSIESEPKPLRAIFVLDLNNPPMDGDVLHDLLIERGYTKRSPVIFLSGQGTIGKAVAAVQKGALDFVEKPDSKGQLIPLLQRAVELESQSSAQTDRCSQLRVMWEALTPQQRKVAVLTAQGLFVTQIADRMNIVERTVEVHRAKGFATLHARKSPQVATVLAEMKACGIDVEIDAT